MAERDQIPVGVANIQCVWTLALHGKTGLLQQGALPFAVTWRNAERETVEAGRFVAPFGRRRGGALDREEGAAVEPDPDRSRLASIVAPPLQYRQPEHADVEALGRDEVGDDDGEVVDGEHDAWCLTPCAGVRSCDDGSVTAAAPSYTPFEDYLVSEASSEVKHEWCDGVVYAMSRGTPEHGRLTMRIARAVGNALAKDCEVYSSDPMLYIEAARLSTYADASIVCGALETKNVRKDGRSLGEAFTNPMVVIEVLSEGTERYDRDGKFQAYKLLPSIQEYVLVAQDVRRIEVYRRGVDDRWSCNIGAAGESVTIHGATVSVDDVYG